MDGSMRPGAANDPCLRLAHGSQTRRELNPHKKEVSSDGLSGDIVCMSIPDRLLVSKTPRFAQEPWPQIVFLLIFACTREAVSHWMRTSSQRCTRNAVPEGGVYVVKSTTTSIAGMCDHTAEAHPHDDARFAPLTGRRSWRIENREGRSR
jgi:hypothetical protein